MHRKAHNIIILYCEAKSDIFLLLEPKSAYDKHIFHSLCKIIRHLRGSSPPLRCYFAPLTTGAPKNRSFKRLKIKSVPLTSPKLARERYNLPVIPIPATFTGSFCLTACVLLPRRASLVKIVMKSRRKEEACNHLIQVHVPPSSMFFCFERYILKNQCFEIKRKQSRQIKIPPSGRKRTPKRYK